MCDRESSSLVVVGLVLLFSFLPSFLPPPVPMTFLTRRGFEFFFNFCLTVFEQKEEEGCPSVICLLPLHAQAFVRPFVFVPFFVPSEYIDAIRRKTLLCFEK